MKNKKIFSKSLIFFILFLPVAVLYICIYLYGVNLVFWDEWETIGIYDDLISNGISFSRLFAQHNEHRMFFPRIIMLISYYFTNCSSKFEMYISAFFLSVSYYFLLKHVIGKKRITDFERKDILISVLLGFCFISACQWENLLWGFQIAWFLIEMSVIVSLAYFSKYFEKDGIKYWLGSIFYATIATYSSLQGVAIWLMYISIFVLLSISKRKLEKGHRFLSFVMIGIFEMALYFYNYSDVASHEKFKAEGLKQCLDFMMMQLGYMFCDSNQIVAKYLGIAVTILAVYLICRLILKSNLEEYLTPVGMIVYGMGVMMMISIGRSNLILSSRYTTYALMVLVGEISILYKEVNKYAKITAVYREWQRIFIAIEGMLLALCIVESMDSLHRCGIVYAERMAATESVQNYLDVSLDELKKVYPWPDYEQAYESIELLAEKKWNVWENSRMLYDIVNTDEFRISEDPLTQYTIDFVGWDDAFKILTLGGWAVDDHSMEAYGNVYVKINNTVYNSKDHQERLDVSEYLGNDAYTYSGFSFSKSTDVLNEGVNAIAILLSASDGDVVYVSPDIYVYYDQSSGIYRCDEYGNAME